MFIYFTILILLIFIFLIGNVLLIYLEKKRTKVLPVNSKDIDSKILNSKIDVLHKRICFVEDNLKFKKNNF
jgi:hypothetical protein